jgi:hypothetical protein
VAPGHILNVPTLLVVCTTVKIYILFTFLCFHITKNQWSSQKLLYFVFQASFHIASAFFGMIIGKSGTTRKRIESETQSRINVPKQGAPKASYGSWEAQLTRFDSWTLTARILLSKVLFFIGPKLCSFKKKSNIPAIKLYRQIIF